MMRQRSGRTLNLRSTTHHHDARRRLQLRRQSTRRRTAAATCSLLLPCSPPPRPCLRHHRLFAAAAHSTSALAVAVSTASTLPPRGLHHLSTKARPRQFGAAQHRTRQRNPCHSRARWRAPHMLISPVKGCRRWSEGASAGSERVWAPQLRMRRQPTWLSSPPGVAIGRGLQPAVQARVRAAVRRRPRATQLSPARSEWSWPSSQPRRRWRRAAQARARGAHRGATSGRKIEARFGAQLRSGGTTRRIPVRV